MLICATSTADNITAVFTAVGSIAAAVAAVAALWAARTSRDTARDAGQALALATKPSFSFGAGGAGAIETGKFSWACM